MNNTNKHVKDVIENLLKIEKPKYNQETAYKFLYESIWNDKDFQNRTVQEMCLLHYYREQYYDRSSDLEFLNRVIYKTCINNNINPEKIFHCSTTGELIPQRFEHYINEDKIPAHYEKVYAEVYEMVMKAKVDVKEEYERYKKYIESLVDKFKLF